MITQHKDTSFFSPLRPYLQYLENYYKCMLLLHTSKNMSFLSIELQLMNAADRETAEEDDHRNRGPRMSVEISFNNIV